NEPKPLWGWFDCTKVGLPPSPPCGQDDYPTDDSETGPATDTEEELSYDYRKKRRNGKVRALGAEEDLLPEAERLGATEIITSLLKEGAKPEDLWRLLRKLRCTSDPVPLAGSGAAPALALAEAPSVPVEEKEPVQLPKARKLGTVEKALIEGGLSLISPWL